ncbi:hypothetical protein BURK2_03467 [Burkholderiales bacterium]|nr:hypothetical protein BURK2_03467 [Burkholderiales bacterium]
MIKPAMRCTFFGVGGRCKWLVISAQACWVYYSCLSASVRPCGSTLHVARFSGSDPACSGARIQSAQSRRNTLTAPCAESTPPPRKPESRARATSPTSRCAHKQRPSQNRTIRLRRAQESTHGYAALRVLRIRPARRGGNQRRSPRVKVNTVSTPGVERAVILPLWALMMRCTVASPMPVPGKSAGLCRRENAVKSLSA